MRSAETPEIPCSDRFKWNKENIFNMVEGGSSVHLLSNISSSSTMFPKREIQSISVWNCLHMHPCVCTCMSTYPHVCVRECVCLRRTGRQLHTDLFSLSDAPQGSQNLFSPLRLQRQEEVEGGEEGRVSGGRYRIK